MVKKKEAADKKAAKTQAKTAEQQGSGPQFRVNRIHAKHLLFQIEENLPNLSQVDWNPDVSININFENKPLKDNLREVVLSLDLSASIKEAKVFTVSVKQAGIFTIEDFPEEQIEPIIEVVCPNMLYPYATAVLADVISRGGFPSINLAPFNFEAAYRQKKQKAAEATG